MPLVGTWIEIVTQKTSGGQDVVPLVGTWVEISWQEFDSVPMKSCPSWARGLKYHREYPCSRAGRRAPRGHVD